MNIISFIIIMCFYYRSQFIFYIFHTAIMTLALILAARKSDPREYDEGVDILRGICEVLLFLCIMYNVFVETYQLKRFVHSV